MLAGGIVPHESETMSYNAGVIGTGGIAGEGQVLGSETRDDRNLASHAGAYSRTSGIELVAAADIDDDRLRSFGSCWNIPSTGLFSSHERMLAETDLDIVSICTPTHLHRTHTIDAVTAGADPDLIWCEKPIASSVADAKRMISVCEETETELLINHSFRFTEEVSRLREFIQAESGLGHVISATGRFKRELLRNGTHLVDVLLHLLETRPTRVAGQMTGETGIPEDVLAEDEGTYDDTGGFGSMQTADGTSVSIDCTLPRALSDHIHCALVGTAGKIRCTIPPDGRTNVQYWNRDGDTFVAVDEFDLSGISTTQEEMFSNAVHHICGVLDGSETNRSPGDEALKAVEAINGMYLADYTDSIVDLPVAHPVESLSIRSW